MNRIAIATLALSLAGCANMTPGQQLAAITLAVQQGATLASLLGGPKATQWVQSGGLVCQVGATYTAVLGANVQGTAAADMQALCKGLGGNGTALPAGVDPATVLVAVLKGAA